MKAWQVSGKSGVLEKDIALNPSATLPNSTTLKPDEMLVKVSAAAINPADHKIAELPLFGRFLLGKGATPGADFAGRVVKTGSGIAAQDGLAPGTAVFGRLEPPVKLGCLAEYTIAPKNGCAALPEGVSFRDGAAMGTAGLTAYQCIAPYVKSGEGKKVFINGGSGGTGVWGIQFAKAMGCHVVTSCSGANADLCRSLGADEVIDYRTQDIVQTLKKSGSEFDLIVDNVGTPHELYAQCHEFTTSSANFIQVGANVSWSASYSLLRRMLWPGMLGGGRRPFAMLQVKNKREDFIEIRRLLAERKAKAVIDQTVDMQDVPKAYQSLKTDRTRGKIVVNVAEI